MTGRPDDSGIMTGSYALDAVDDIERAEMDAAIGLSDELRAEVDSLRDTALLLAYATAPVEPSPDLKSSLMAKIALTPQLAPVPAPDAAPAVQATDSGLEAQDQAAPSLQTVGGGSAAATARRRWFQRPASILTAAAAAVVIFVGGGLGITAALQGDNGAQSGQTQASSQLDSIYAAADFQRSSTPVTGGGTATVVWSKSVGKSGVILDGVNTLPKDKTYELWYIGSKIVPAGLVSPTGSGTTSAVLDGKLSGTPTVGVTVEPAGGSKQPTTKPIVAVPTSA